MTAEGGRPAAATPIPDPSIEKIATLAAGDYDPLLSADVGLRVIRGGAIRLAGYSVGMLLTAAASVFLLRYLGVATFGRYATVMSLIAIVDSLTDAGLSAVGARNLAQRPRGEERRRFLGGLLGLRLVLTPLGALAAVLFAVLAGYEQALVIGLVLAGIGLMLTTCQVTMTLPLSIELRIGRLTLIELVRQTVMLFGIALLVAVGANLTAFFAVPIAVGIVTIAATPLFVGRDFVWHPHYSRSEWQDLIHDVLPLAAATVVGVIYFRLLIVLTALLATAVATGLFATSFRVTEMLLAVSSLVLTVLVPVLAVTAGQSARIGYMFQRMIEMALMTSGLLVVIVVIVAEPVLNLLGGDEYRAAAPVLKIEVFALVPLFVGQACGVTLVALRRQAVVLPASLIALALVLIGGFSLIPMYGATGAAIAAVIAETGLTLSLLVALARGAAPLKARFGFVWKVLLAFTLASIAGAAPGLPAFVAAFAAIAVYAVSLIVVRAVPSEVFDAFALRRNSP